MTSCYFASWLAINSIPAFCVELAWSQTQSYCVNYTFDTKYGKPGGNDVLSHFKPCFSNEKN